MVDVRFIVLFLILTGVGLLIYRYPWLTAPATVALAALAIAYTILFGLPLLP